MHKVVDEATGKTAVQILFDDVAPKFKDVNGGYTTILKTYNRKGDNAPMAILSLTKKWCGTEEIQSFFYLTCFFINYRMN